MDQKHFSEFRQTFAANDLEVTNFVRELLNRRMHSDADMKTTIVTVCSSLISEASQLLNILQMSQIKQQRLIRISAYMGELMVLGKRHKIDLHTITELMAAFTVQLDKELPDPDDEESV